MFNTIGTFFQKILYGFGFGTGMGFAYVNREFLVFDIQDVKNVKDGIGIIVPDFADVIDPKSDKNSKSEIYIKI